MLLENLTSYRKTGKAGVCPRCGHDTISVDEHRISCSESDGAYSLSWTMRCKNCGLSDHIDGPRKAYDKEKPMN